LGCRSIDEGSIDEASGMNFAEYVAILSGDTNLLEKAKLEKKITVVESERTMFYNDRYKTSKQIEETNGKIEDNNTIISRLKSDLEVFQKRQRESPDELPNVELAGVGGGLLTERISKKLHSISETAKTNGLYEPIGTLYNREFTLLVKTEASVKDEFEFVENRFFVEHPQSKIKYSYNHGILAQDPEKACANFVNALSRIPEIIEGYEHKNADLVKPLPVLQEMVSKEWTKAEELRELRGKLLKLGISINEKIKDMNKIKPDTANNGISEEHAENFDKMDEVSNVVSEPVNIQLQWKYPTDAVSLLPEGAGLPQTDGEITAVERILSEQKPAVFMGEALTGKVRIETAQDVAFLFKNLENAASENVFAVLHKNDDTYAVLYVSTGTATTSVVDVKLIVAAASELDAAAVTLVHNHPSGTLIASKDDYSIHAKLKEAFSGTSTKVHDSIIINTDSGKFCVFNSDGDNILDKKISAGESIGAKVYQFDRKNLYTPTNRLDTIKAPKDVAEFLSRQKRGVTSKLHAIVLDQASHITRYFLIDKNLSIDILKNKLTVETGKHGENIILATNGVVNKKKIDALGKQLGSSGIRISDVLTVQQNKDIINNYVSFAESGMLDYPAYTSVVRDSINLTGGKAIPTRIGKIELSAEQRKKLAKGDIIRIKGLTDKFGKKCTSIVQVRWNRQKNKIEFSTPIKNQQIHVQAQGIKI
jgi:hypothetical protein